MHHLNTPRRQARLMNRPASLNRRSRPLGLEHEGVAARQARAGLHSELMPEVERVIPARPHPGRRSEWTSMPGPAPGTRPERWGMPRQNRLPDAALDVAAGVGQRFAVLATTAWPTRNDGAADQFDKPHQHPHGADSMRLQPLGPTAEATAASMLTCRPSVPSPGSGRCWGSKTSAERVDCWRRYPSMK